jgi:hypothetical protein
MLDATQQMLPLLPDRPPYGHIVEVAIHDPGGCRLYFQLLQTLAHGAQRLLHFARLAHKVFLLTREEPVVQDPAAFGHDPQHIQRAISRHQIPIEIANLHQIRHLLRVALAQVRFVHDQPQLSERPSVWLSCVAQMLKPLLSQLGRQMLCAHL